MLSTSVGGRFLDKTPANALVLPFLTRLYPRAKYVVLTRHPLAVFSSFANSFFNGDWEAAHAFNPVVERYVPAMASLLRERSVPFVQVAYEDLVASPASELERIFAFLGLENQPEAVDYGKGEGMKAGMGDPIGVKKHARPVTDSLQKWAEELVSDPSKRDLARAMIERVDPRDLEAWGWPLDRIFSPVEEAGGEKPPTPVLNRYTFQRRVMLALKRDIHSRPHGRLLRRVKYYCDVLLRE